MEVLLPIPDEYDHPKPHVTKRGRWACILFGNNKKITNCELQITNYFSFIILVAKRPNIAVLVKECPTFHQFKFLIYFRKG